MEAEEIIAHWQEEPPTGDLLRAYLGKGRAPVEAIDDVGAAPREVSEEEWRRIVAEDKAFAASTRRNPFT